MTLWLGLVIFYLNMFTTGMEPVKLNSCLSVLILVLGTTILSSPIHMFARLDEEICLYMTALFNFVGSFEVALLKVKSLQQ